MAGQLSEGSAEASYIGIADSLGDLTYGQDAGAERVLVLQLNDQAIAG